MYGGGAEAEVKGSQAVVEAVRNGFGGDADSGSGGGTGGGGGGGWDRGGEGLSWWEDNAEHLMLGTEPNSHLAYPPGLELHHLITRNIREHGGWIYRDR